MAEPAEHFLPQRPTSNLAPAPSPSKTARVRYIDTARGLFLVLMASSHAMTLAEIPPSSPLATWWLPRGWATTGFVLLCGFTAASLARATGDRVSKGPRFFRRGLEVLAVMFLSNAAMLVLKNLLTRRPDLLADPEWWIGLITLRTDASLSAILLPIGLFLLASPFLIETLARCRSAPRAVLFHSALVLFALASWAVHHVAAPSLARRHWLDLMLGAGGAGFPVVPYVALGGLGLVLGTLWPAPRERFNLGMAVAIVLYLVALKELYAVLPPMAGRILDDTLIDAGQFLVVVVVAIALAQCQRVDRLLAVVPLLGSCSLLVFLAHRVLIQGLGFVLKPLSLPAELVYGSCFAVSIVGSALLIVLRRRWETFDRRLRALYL